MSQNFQDFAPQERIDHINKTLELISKQKVFYSRLQMMVNYVEEDGDEPSEVAQMKERIDNLSAIYSGGNNLLQILQVMEDKLLGCATSKTRPLDNTYIICHDTHGTHAKYKTQYGEYECPFHPLKSPALLASVI